MMFNWSNNFLQNGYNMETTKDSTRENGEKKRGLTHLFLDMLIVLGIGAAVLLIGLAVDLLIG
jgi:hypothetical protein